ncbi:MAG: hypothetical protein K0Q73_7211 [Paenibacillus sp.]|nr:hypothetical protein [Paenibacillus sp.]
MADVQIDDGNFTQIANVLLEKVSSAKLNGCQHAIILQVWRYTYGFKRKQHDLSAGFIATATGYNKRQVEREMKVLVARKMVFQKVIDGVSRTLSFNKDFDSWLTPGELADGQEADGQYTDGELVPKPPARMPTVTPGELADQERKVFKEINKATTERPEIFIQKEYAALHGKFMENIKQNEIIAIYELVKTEIPPEFIINTMKMMHDREKNKGGTIRTFTYYTEGIKNEWKQKTQPVRMSNKKQDKLDLLKRLVKEGEHEQSGSREIIHDHDVFVS